ncbi:MAG: hypothetical protein LBT01_02000 [Spirochaetaceae bacterium]|jgi:hypothetical protein|nr:hypothetical protein [Spirochaetaceae bacterium]
MKRPFLTKSKAESASGTKMKVVVTCCLCVLIPSFVFAAGPQYSGIFDSTLHLAEGGGEAQYGLEEYANLRLKWNAGDYGSVYAAFNVLAASGIDALRIPQTLLGVSAANGNYAASIELERLYFHLLHDKFAIDGGLMRLAFGYGNAFSPMDFFNQKNPLKPDARLRAVLGGDIIYYPTDMSSLKLFAAAPRAQQSTTLQDMFTGISGEAHTGLFSVQGIYFWQPKEDDHVGYHYGGVSLKADLALGIVLDTLYSYTGNDTRGVEGFSLSFGFDYTFSVFDRTLSMLAEYLFNGQQSATAFNAEYNTTGLHHHHFIFASFQYALSDLSALSAAALCCIDDGSIQPMLSFDHDIFQGAHILLQMGIPLDTNGSSGELGPAAGSRFWATLKWTLRL